MPIVTVNTTDSIATVVSDINTISSNIGNGAKLFFSDNCVDAINKVKTITEIYDDSDKIVDTVYASYNAVATDFADALYDDNGNFTFTGAIDSDVRALFSITGDAVDYENGVLSITDSVAGSQLNDSAITTTKFNNTEVLRIYDNDSSVLLTLYGPAV